MPLCKKNARLLSIKSSNAIEGITTSDSSLKEIVDNNKKGTTHAALEISGYKDALDFVYSSYDRLDICEKDIRAIHALVMQYSAPAIAGQLKAINNVIIEIDDSGKKSVRFRPISASDTPEAMDHLVLAYFDALSNPKINALVLIPCVILDFLCIHPFKDGNGRVSRLLAILLLLKTGFDVVKYASIEAQIDAHRDYYYKALADSSVGWSAGQNDGSAGQVGWNMGQNDYFPFIRNFLFTLCSCYKRLSNVI